MLTLPESPRSTINSAAVAGYPDEVCGVLVGRREGLSQREDAGRAWVERAVQAGNLNVVRAHDRYELDPLDFMRADEAAREEGLEVVGIWHTHPNHAAKPSEADRKAAWEGWSYVIATVTAAGVEDVRSWRLHGGRFVEEDVLTHGDLATEDGLDTGEGSDP